MKNFIGWGVRISILSYAFLHLFTAFFDNPFLVKGLSVTGILMILFTALTIPIRKFKLPIFILLSGIVVLLYSDTPFINGVFLELYKCVMSLDYSLSSRSLVGFCKRNHILKIL